MINKMCLLWLLIGGLLATADAQELNGKKKDIEAILANIAQFSEYYMNGEYRKLAECYTTDGKIMPAGPEIIEGLDAIEERWTLPEDVKILRHEIHPEEIRVIGDHAYDYGYYEGETLRPNGDKVSWRGKYVIVWRKVDGDWKIYLDIWNRVDS